MIADLALLALVLGAVAAVWRWRRRREGAVRDEAPGEQLADDHRAALGVPPETAVLLEFTAPGCRSCEAARDVLEAVAAERTDVVVATADVGERLDLARAHRVLRAPTTLVVDRGGRVRHRISGVPSAAELAGTLDCSGSQ